MSEEEATEKQINDFLETVMESNTIDPIHTLKAFAKLIFNLRFDLNELKLELIKVLKEDDDITSIGPNGECRNEEFYT